MPNLNKIRGQKKNSAGPPAGSKTGLGRGQHNYGLSSRHHNSDPRMVPGHPGSRQVQTGYNQQQNQGVPSRGTVLSRDVRFFVVLLVVKGWNRQYQGQTMHPIFRKDFFNKFVQN